MNKLIRIILLSIFILTFPLTSVADSSVIKIKQNGVKEISTLEMNITKNGTKTITEVDGEAVNGKFKVNDKSFKGQIISRDGTKIKLSGQLVSSGDNNLIYKGDVEKSPTKVFSALLTKDENSEEYNAFITIETYETDKLEDLINGETYLFNNSSPQYFTHNSFNTLNQNYYDELRFFDSVYMQTLVEGPSVIGAGQSDFHSLRSTTKTDRIDDYWEMQEGCCVVENSTRVRNHNIDISTGQAAAFVPIDPAEDVQNYFKVPIYTERLGLLYIPVKTSSTTISGKGTSNLSFNFSSLYYWDDAGVYNSPSPFNDGFGARYQLDTIKEIDTSRDLRINVSSEFQYQTKFFNGRTFYLYKTTATNFTYFVDLVE